MLILNNIDAYEPYKIEQYAKSCQYSDELYNYCKNNINNDGIFYFCYYCPHSKIHDLILFFAHLNLVDITKSRNSVYANFLTAGQPINHSEFIAQYLLKTHPNMVHNIYIPDEACGMSYVYLERYYGLKIRFVKPDKAAYKKAINKLLADSKFFDMIVAGDVELPLIAVDRPEYIEAVCNSPFYNDQIYQCIRGTKAFINRNTRNIKSARNI